jgi:hypothetical protein
MLSRKQGMRKMNHSTNAADLVKPRRYRMLTAEC